METVPNTFPGMFWSYLIVWLLIGAYVISLNVRLRKLERKIAEKSGDEVSK